MAYQPLRLAADVPNPITRFVRDHVDMQFHDVHCMLRLPMKSRGLGAGCNFAAASFLLSLIAGLSTALYKRTGGSGARFKRMLEKYYPWEAEPTNGVGNVEGARDLYDLFRNPLAHALGLNTKEKGRRAAKRIVLRKGNGDALFIAKNDGLSERQVVTLERAATRPAYARGTILVDGKRKMLLVEGLYWGTRELVTRLTRDNELMQESAAFLTARD